MLLDAAFDHGIDGLGRASGLVEADGVDAGKGREGAGVVGQDERVGAGGVGEEVEDTFAFHKAGEKVEGCFAVLHTIVASHVGSGQGVLVVGQAQVAKDLGNNVGDGLVLKDALIGIHAQKSEPRLNASKVGCRSIL